MKLTLLLFTLLFFCGNAFPQGSYFKIIEQPYTSLYQRLALFPDGSVLVGDRLHVGPTSLSKRGFYLARFDPCGEMVWAKYFNPPGNRLLFDAIEIGPDGSVFVMGTEISGSTETLFLMKLNEAGEVLKYRHFPGNWDEVFSYSLDLKNGRVMVSGLIFHLGPEKQGFVSMFNSDLDLLWARQFDPFIAYGETIATDDGGALATTRNLLVKLDGTGQLEWSVETGPSIFEDYQSMLETEAGYLFERFDNGYSDLFLLSKNGELVWLTEKFPAHRPVDGLRLLPDDNALLFYNCPGNMSNNPCQLRVSPFGEIFQQKRLEIDYPILTSFMSFVVGDDGNVHLFGQVSGGGFSVPDYYSDFLTCFPLDAPAGDCFAWENFESTELNDVELTVSPVSVTVTDAAFMTEEQPIFNPQSIGYSEIEICPLVGSITVERTEHVLTCGESWKITLPHPAFVWQDSSSENPRLLAEPGTYRASMVECRDTTVLEFSLEMRCSCNVFLPNAISPNGDGQNDELRPFSNCGFAEIQLDVYDRWGGRVFRSDDPAVFWDGNFKGKPVAAGVYVVHLRYRLVNVLGVEREGEVVQDVVVVF